MGGNGSGRRGGSRDCTGDYRQLDALMLYRKSALADGTCSEISWGKDSLRNAFVHVAAHSNRITLSSICRSNGVEWVDAECFVEVAWTPCHFGGFRPWFYCPAVSCHRRVRILYGGTIFACRHCHQLAYPCQSESAEDRAKTRAYAIRSRVGRRGSFIDPFPLRPKGMHVRTYYRLQWQYETAVTVALIQMGRKLGMTFENAH